MSQQLHSQVLAEKYLKGIISNGGVNKRYWVDTTKFERPSHRAIATVLKEMQHSGSAMTPELIIDRLLRDYSLQEAMNPEAIYSFVQSAVDMKVPKAELTALHDAVVKNYVFGRAKVVMAELLNKMDSGEALDEAMDIMRYLKAQNPSQTANLGEQMREAHDEAVNGSRSLIPYHIGIMNRRMGGAPRGEVTVIAGRPGHGKTSFATDLAGGWLDQGKKVMIVSKEMKSFRLLHKLIANKAGYSSTALHRGEIPDSDKEAFEKACMDLAAKYEGRLFIHDDVYEMSKIETLCAKYQPDVIIDDFIQLSACDDANIRLEILSIMKSYKQIAKEYNLAAIVLSQLNRSIETREDPVPRLSDLAESGAIEQLAANVLFVYYGHKVKQEEPADQVVIVAGKTRYGTTGQFKLGFDGDHMIYREIPVGG